ncbi:MAG: 5-deoxy-glucuronate isomerase [Bacteroidetes bacterium]|nr:5-deoxy-glucuronate isomerase [Bacteroidota bacterium]
MVVRQDEAFADGYTAITEIDGNHADMLLNFGILKLAAGETWQDSDELERAWILIRGSVEYSWDDQVAMGSRVSCFDENPVVLHVPRGTSVSIKALEACEFGVESCRNEKAFTPRFYAKEDIRCDVFGAGLLNETSIRTVRTVFDGELAPESNMVLGEVINHPGKWSSYPPHDHPQPEIYHYRFFPKQGFGISLLGDAPQYVKNGDTSLISPDVTHSQVAGAGYAMYYIWMIPHLEGDRWLPTTRYYVKDHEWLLEPGVAIWPERKYSGEDDQ